MLRIAILCLLLMPLKAEARDALDMWNSRCEECHSDNVAFAAKYLWNIDGELQGWHHIDNLDLFLRQHYLPAHEFEMIRNMLLAHASSPTRFKNECASCHGDIAAFVEKSIWVRGNTVTGLGTGQDLEEYLAGHRDLLPKDIFFYLRLFARVAGKPFYYEDLLLDAVTR